MTVDGIVQGMRFGVFGREDGTLVLIYKRRGIDVKMIGRKFNFQVKFLNKFLVTPIRKARKR